MDVGSGWGRCQPKIEWIPRRRSRNCRHLSSHTPPQAFFYNGVANYASLGTQMWCQTATAVVGLGCAFALRSSARAGEKEREAEEARPLVVSTTVVEG